MALIILLALLAGIVWAIIWAVPKVTGFIGSVFDGEEEQVESPSDEATSVPTDRTDCTLDQLDIGLETTYQGNQPPLRMTYTLNVTGPVGCLFDAGSGQVSARVTSGSHLIWDSSYCASGDSRRLLIAPDTPYAVDLSWDGLVTDESCAAQRPAAQPGTYNVELFVNGEAVEGTRETFTIDTPVAPPEAPSE